ncbi:MAG: DUF6781 family protein [Caldimonas sp.]
MQTNNTEEMNMMKSGIDQEALSKMFAEAGAKQGENLRKAVADATLKALQGRELTLENIRKVVKNVTQATTTGAAQNPASAVDVEGMLGKALSGMDAALLQAVEANRKALEQFVDQGAGLQDGPLKAAVGNLEKMEDMFFAAVTKATQTSGPLQPAWESALGAMKMKGTDTGTQASAVVEQLMEQAQSALREGRANSLRTAKAMIDSYAAIVSGVLIGMSEGLQQRTSASAPAAEASKSRRR